MKFDWKKILFFSMLFFMLFCGNGCAQFRAIFSEPAAAKKENPQNKRRKKAQDPSLQSKRYNRDPLDDLFFKDRKRSENWSKNSNLTGAEKDALRYALDPDDEATRKVVDRVYLENERKRSRRQKEIYNFKIFQDK